MLLFFILEIYVNTYAEHLIGACEIICVDSGQRRVSLLIFLFQVLIICPEVGYIDRSILHYAEFGTETDGITACYKTHIAEIRAITQPVLCALHTRTDKYSLGDIPFGTCQKLLCVVLQKLLFVVCHPRTFVEEVVIAGHYTY